MFDTTISLREMKQFYVDKYDYIVKYVTRSPVYYKVQKLYLKTGHLNGCYSNKTCPAQEKCGI